MLCGLYAVWRPPSTDFASGDFRAHLLRRGAYLWNNLWFAGHPLPGYGMVTPALSAVLGVVPVAIASVLGATWCFGLLVERWWIERPGLPSPAVGLVLFSCGCVVNLLAGRLTFGPAVFFGTASLLAVQRRRSAIAVVLGALCGLCSPVGAVSLVVVLAAVWLSEPGLRRMVIAVSVSTVVPIGALIVTFPEGGWFPFTGSSFVLLAVALAVAGCVAREHLVIRRTVIVYGTVAAAAFMVRSPLGGNVVRLGWLLAAPAAALLVRRHRRAIVPAVAAFGLLWSGAYVRMAFIPSTEAGSPTFYDSLADFLHTLPQPLRLEVVPTTTLGQADQLALATTGIARGWETQVDRELNPEFYGGHLDTATFHRWLLDHAVSIVAVPREEVRSQSLDEAAIVEAAPAYLAPIWSNTDWKVYRLVDARPLADHSSTVTDVEPESLTIDAPLRGWTVVKFRYTNLYRVRAGSACVTATPDGWIRLRVDHPGRIVLTIGISSAVVLHQTADCKGPQGKRLLST